MPIKIVGIYLNLKLFKMKESKESHSEFIAKVLKGLKLSSERMIKSKIEKNQSMVIMRDGKMITIKASELNKL